MPKKSRRKKKKTRGRPLKKTGSDKDKRLREMWREASSKYYKKNREEILKKAKSKTGKKRRKK